MVHERQHLEELPPDPTRRAFAKGLLATFALGSTGLFGKTIHDGLTIADAAMERAYENTVPSLNFIGKSPYCKQERVVFVLPGFDDRGGERYAGYMYDSCVATTDSAIAYFDYGNSGIRSTDELVALAREQLDMSSTKEVDVVGVSTGGLFAIDFIGKLGVPVKNLVLRAAPSSFDNVYLAEPSWVLAKIPRRVRSEYLVYAAAYFAKVYRSSQVDGFDLRDNMENGARRMRNGYDPMGLDDINRLAHSIDINSDEVRAGCSRVLSPEYGSRVCYVRSYLSSDSVVELDPSDDDFGTLCRGVCGVPYATLFTSSDKHPDLASSMDEVGAWWNKRV